MVCATRANSAAEAPRTCARPELDQSDAAWGEYLFFRDNPKGVHLERWRHTYGCGQWFNLARNTVTHEILSVYAITDPPPP